MRALASTRAGEQMEADFTLLRMLISLEVTYKIVVTDKNRAII